MCPHLLVLLAFLVNSLNIECAPSVTGTIQDVTPKPGYIPVFIRNGNTPLEEINLELAEAFDSYAYKHYKFDYAKMKNRLNDGGKKNENNVIGNVNDGLGKRVKVNVHE